MSKHGTVTAEQSRYALTYRGTQARQVMDWVRAGQSGCLIGLRGAGKSNFLHFLLRKDVQEHYLGQANNDFAFVLVDLLALTKWSEWAVLELIFDRLLVQLPQLGMAPEVVQEMTSLRKDITHSKDSLVAERAVERCVEVLCRPSVQRLVLFLDEFDTVFRTLDPFLFRCLRAIRDAHKGQVSYIVVVANELTYLRDDLNDVEQFYRLVSRNTCGLGPYSQGDARQMIRYLASERSLALSAEDTARLIALSGGHAGLLKATLSLLWGAGQEGGIEKLVPALEDEPAIQAECSKVWAGLSGMEQAALRVLVSGAQVDPNGLRRLRLKGLIHEGETDTPGLFSPLFADFVRQQAPPSRERVVIDRSHGTALVDGQRVDLTELEFEMLCYLFDRRGQVCTKDDLIANVYHQQYDRMEGGIDDARLQTLISRLRAKVEPPRQIVTVRGEGYKFVEPIGQ